MNEKFSIWELVKGMFFVSLIGSLFLWVTFSFFIKDELEQITKIDVPNVTSPVTSTYNNYEPTNP